MDICDHPAQPNSAEHWAAGKPGHRKNILHDWILGDGTNELQNDNRWQEAGDPTEERRILEKVADPAYSTAALFQRMRRTFCASLYHHPQCSKTSKTPLSWKSLANVP